MIILVISVLALCFFLMGRYLLAKANKEGDGGLGSALCGICAYIICAIFVLRDLVLIYRLVMA